MQDERDRSGGGGEPAASVGATAGAAAAPPRRKGLHLDRILSSQPELGPTPPDGGSSWVVAAAAATLRVLLPALLVSYGPVILLEAAAAPTPEALPPPNDAYWNGAPLWVPVLFSASWNLAAPWSRTLAATGSARAVCASGLLLAAGGTAAAAVLAAAHSGAFTYLVGVGAGVLAGGGCALSLAAADAAVRQHFRLRLLRAQTLVRAAQAAGCVLAPLAAFRGLQLARGALWPVQLVQAALVAGPGLLAASALRPPFYRSHPSPAPASYELLKAEAGPSGHDGGGGGGGGGGRGGGAGDLTDSDVELLAASPSPSDVDDSADPRAARPLFSDVELSAAGRQLAVFVDDPADEEVVLYANSSRVRGRYSWTSELRALGRPRFYAGLALVAASQLSSLAYWLLAPAVVWSNSCCLLPLPALGVVVLGGVVDLLVAYAWPLLAGLGAHHKARVVFAGGVLATVGLFGLSVSKDAPIALHAAWALFTRLGVAANNTLLKPMLRECLGPMEFVHSLSLLDTLSGLLVLLATLSVGNDYTRVFWNLGWLSVCTTVLAGSVPYLSASRCAGRGGH